MVKKQTFKHSKHKQQVNTGNNKRIPFEIRQLDSLGQGISYHDKKIVFIKNALPGEKGMATLTAEQSKHSFARIESLSDITEFSKLRKSEACRHTLECGGCSYQFLDYETEWAHKVEITQREVYYWLKKYGPLTSTSEEDIKQQVSQVLTSHSAKGYEQNYRRRIQLHYDKNKNLIGLFRDKTHELFQIKECEQLIPPLKNYLTNTCIAKPWQKSLEEILKNQPTIGHIEFQVKDYPNNQEVSLTINQPYASEGFEQIHYAMNERCLNLLKQKVEEKYLLGLRPVAIDLFSGGGNLSNFSLFEKRILVDNYFPKDIDSSLQNQDSFSTYKINLLQTFSDLKKDPSFTQLINRLSQSQKDNEQKVLFIDPPRAGFKEIVPWVQLTRPETIFYLSCHPATLWRDLSQLKKSLSDYRLEEVHLFDFFPRTAHREILIIIKKEITN